jgi:hypothetical protein
VLLSSGADPLAALNSGYHIAFFVGAVFATSAGLLGAALVRIRDQAPADDTIVASDPGSEMKAAARTS